MKFLDGLAPIAHWFLRVALAGVFLYHGLTKFPNLAGTAEFLGMPLFVAGLLAAAETLAGILILLGGFLKDWMTRLAGLIIAVVMIGAIFKVHLANGWSFMNNGMEFQFTLTMLGLYFLAVGNRPHSTTTV